MKALPNRTTYSRLTTILIAAVYVLFGVVPTYAQSTGTGAALQFPFYDPGFVGLSDGCSANLVGSDNEQKTWNYFKGKGLSDAQVAGIMGNIQQESSFDPERIQNGGDSQNPADAGSGGWGIIQWTPGTKIIDMAQQAGVSGLLYDLGVQLDLVWQHMNNNPVVTRTFDLNSFSQISNATEAAVYFRDHIEGGTDPIDPNTGQPVRESNALKILQQYGGTGSTAGGLGGCTIGAGTDCTTISGSPKILCEAQKYQGIYYRLGGGHQGYSTFIASCPDPSNQPNNQPSGGDNGGNPSPCATDCSSLVSIAVDEAFNLNYMWTINGTMQGDGAQYWKKIPIIQASAGDIVTTSDHVEIVDHIGGGMMHTFGSHQTGTKTGPTASTLNYWSAAWRWTGPGSVGG